MSLPDTVTFDAPFNPHPHLVSKSSQDKWDRFYLGMAEYVAQKSKDPSTKTGAVITDAKNRLISVGYNGFARKVKDTYERLNNREIKYEMVIHCEVNAQLLAKRDLEGCTLYTWPFSSCSRCAAQMIQAGIIRCVAPHCPPKIAARWGNSIKLAIEQFEEAGVEVVLLQLEA